MAVRFEVRVLDAPERVKLVEPETGEMPTTEPGPHRAGLGFVEVVEAAFEFLERDFGLRLVRAEPTFVRYEGDLRFVNVFHGRASYELGVEIGHWVELDGERVEERFGLRHAVILSRDPEEVGFRAFTASDSATVARFVPQLAEWAREFIGPVIVASDDAVFDRMRGQATRESQLYQQEGRAAILRRQAEAAWQDHDFDRVVLAYRELLDELPLVQLKRSELGRLHYAEGKLDPGAR